MKTSKLLVFSFLLAAPLFAQDRAAQVQATYQQGLIALRNGEADIARQAFQAVLEMDPRHANARFQLSQLAQQTDQLSVRKRELAFSRIVVPLIDFNGATFKDALDGLAAVVERESAGKFAANFVIRDPSGALPKAEVSLKLRGVPANVVLKYLCEQAGAIYQVEEHGIVVRPASTGTTVVNPPAEKPAAGEPAGAADPPGAPPAGGPIPELKDFLQK